jgi:hypothetical protein
MKQTLRRNTLMLVLLSTLTACGGGGGSDPQPNNDARNWDSMVWDQDNWS